MCVCEPTSSKSHSSEDDMNEQFYMNEHANFSTLTTSPSYFPPLLPSHGRLYGQPNSSTTKWTGVSHEEKRARMTCLWWWLVLRNADNTDSILLLRQSLVDTRSHIHNINKIINTPSVQNKCLDTQCFGRRPYIALVSCSDYVPDECCFLHAQSPL